MLFVRLTLALVVVAATKTAANRRTKLDTFNDCINNTTAIISFKGLTYARESEIETLEKQENEKCYEINPTKWSRSIIKESKGEWVKCTIEPTTKIVSCEHYQTEAACQNPAVIGALGDQYPLSNFLSIIDDDKKCEFLIDTDRMVEASKKVPDNVQGALCTPNRCENGGQDACKTYDNNKSFNCKHKDYRGTFAQKKWVCTPNVSINIEYYEGKNSTENSSECLGSQMRFVKDWTDAIVSLWIGSCSPVFSGEYIKCFLKNNDQTVECLTYSTKKNCEQNECGLDGRQYTISNNCEKNKNKFISGIKEAQYYKAFLVEQCQLEKKIVVPTSPQSCNSQQQLCKNGGVFDPTNTTSEQSCVCPFEYKGRFCTAKKRGEHDTCKPANPCKNSGVCTNIKNVINYTCTCPPGFSGKDCETLVDACNVKSCQNNGVCINNAAGAAPGYTCKCLTGFSGKYCETNTVSTNYNNTNTTNANTNTTNANTNTTNANTNTTNANTNTNNASGVVVSGFVSYCALITAAYLM